MNKHDFVYQRERSKVYEKAFSRYLQTEYKLFVLATYDFSGSDNDKAPKLLRTTEGLVIPDLFGARSGKCMWCEIKVKQHADIYRKTQTRVTGLPYRHWKDYLAVSQETGITCWIAFIHEDEDTVRLTTSEALQQRISHIYEGNVMDRGGTIFFKFDAIPQETTVSHLRLYTD